MCDKAKYVVFEQNSFPFHNWTDVNLPVCIWFISWVSCFNPTFSRWVWHPGQYTSALHLSSVHLDHITSNQEKHKSLLLLHLISSLWLTLGACGVLSSLELYVSLSFWPCFWNFYLLLLNSLVYLAFFFIYFIFCLFSVSCRSLCHALPPASVLVLFSHQQPISSCFFLLFFSFFFVTAINISLVSKVFPHC